MGLRYFSEYECNGYVYDITMAKEQLDVNLVVHKTMKYPILCQTEYFMFNTINITGNITSYRIQPMVSMICGLIFQK